MTKGCMMGESELWEMNDEVESETEELGAKRRNRTPKKRNAIITRVNNAMAIAPVETDISKEGTTTAIL